MFMKKSFNFSKVLILSLFCFSTFLSIGQNKINNLQNYLISTSGPQPSNINTLFDNNLSTPSLNINYAGDAKGHICYNWLGNLNGMSTYVFDLKEFKNITNIHLKNILTAGITPSGTGTINYNSINATFRISTQLSSLGSWDKILDTSLTVPNSDLNIITNKVSRYWKIEILNCPNVLVNCGFSTLSGCPLNIGEIELYERPLIFTNSSNTFPLQTNQCTTLTAGGSGDTYLWSTGETTQSIQVCNAGTYTCQVTNTSFTGNQDHVASISIGKIESQDSLPSPNGEVYSVFKNGNTVYYGGDFNAVGPVTGSGTYIDNVSGQPKTSLPRIVGTINTTISDNAGGWYIGGKFTKVGNYAISNLAHIKVDNSVDTAFKPQPNGAVLSMILNGSSFYIGGEFTTIQGIANNYVAKIDKNTGASVLWNAQCNGIVRSIALATDQIVVGGDFTSIGGQARNYLASLDTVYVQASTWNPNPNNKVYKVYTTGTKLYVGGDFTTISTIAKGYGAGYSLPGYTLDGYNFGANGRIHDFITNNNVLYAAGQFTTIGGANRNYLAGLNPLNVLANSFNATADGIVRSLAVSGGNLIVGGDFSAIGGQSRNRLAALNVTTGVATAWNPSIIGEKLINPTVNTIATSGNAVYVGGTFYSVGATVRNNAAAIDATTGQILPWNPNTNGIVRAIAADNNNVYLGGDFTTVNGTVTKNRIAQVNATSGVATGWNPNADNSVNALILMNNLLYVGGNFGNIGGAARSKFAVLSAVSGSASAFNPAPNGNVNALAINGDTLYIGGDFTSIGGQTRNRLASYQLSNSTLLAFNPNINATVSALASTKSKLYVGGAFSLVGSSLRYNFAEIDVVTGNATTLNTNVINGSSVNSIVIQDSSVYSGGGYQYYNSGQPISNLATIKTKSGFLGYWQPQPDDIIRTIALGTNKAYVGGRFKQINSRYQPFFASLDIYNSGSAPVITSVPNVKGCIGASLEINGSGFTNIMEVNIGETKVPFVVNSSTSITITPTTALTGKVKVVNVLGSPISSETVTINALPSATITASGATTFCQGGSVTLTSSAGSSYLWSTGATTASITPTTAGSYSVKVTNVNGCSNTSAPIILSVNPLPLVDSLIIKTGNTTLCQSQSLFLDINPIRSQNLTCVWQKNGIDTIAAKPDVSFEVKTAGNYTLVTTDANNCKAISKPIYVVVNPTPTGTITASKTGLYNTRTICQGDSIVLSVVSSTAVSYTWKKNFTPIQGASKTSYTVKESGVYTVFFTDAKGCSGEASGFVIDVIALEQPIISAQGTVNICQGESIRLSTEHGTGVSSTWKLNGNIITSNKTNTIPVNSYVDANKSGSYTVTTTFSGCNFTSIPTTVNVNSFPSALINTPTSTSFCSGDSLLLTANQGIGYSYQWKLNGVVISNATKYNYYAKQEGSYTVDVSNAANCTTSSNAIALTIKLLTVATISTNGPSTFCQGGNVTLSSSVGSAYLWSTGATTSSISVNSSGSYYVTVTDANGCKAISKTTNVVVNSLPLNGVTVSGTGSLTPNGWSYCQGSNFNLIASNGNTYLWSNGEKTQSISPISSGNYTVEVTDINGCKSTSQVTKIIVNPSPNLSATASKTALCTGETVTLTATGATTYSWDNNVSNGVSFVPIGTKTYTVTGTDANGCKNTNSVLVTVNSLPTVVANASKTALCMGDNVTLTGIGASTYTWDNNVSNGVSFVPSVTKTYTVTGTDANGCKNTANVLVTVNSLPTVIANSNKSVVCSGDNVTLTGSGASTYTWDNNVSNGVSFAINTTKTYNVTGTDANGCKNTSSVSISVNSLPIVLANANKTAVCTGDNVTLTGNGASTYAWDNNVSNGVSFVPSATKTYTVTGTDANGCKNTSNVLVTVNALPTVVANATKTAICLGDNVTLTGSGASTYVWDNNVSNGVSFVPSATKTYSVTGTDVNGCKNIANVIITVNTLPTVIAYSNKSIVCSGDNVTLTGSGASTYTWNNNITNAVSFVPSVTKTYTVTGTDANGCKNTANVLVTVNSLPTVVANATKTTVCTGDNVILIGTGASTYVWDNNVTNGVSFVPNTTKTYIVTGTDVNGCKNTANLIVTVNSLPTVTANSNKSVVCLGDNVTLTGSGASTYVWDNNVSNSVSFVPSATKTYTVTGMDANGCKNIANVMVTVNSLPAVVATATKTAVCSGDNITLTGTGASTYTWDNNVSNGVSFVPSATKTYSVTGTDINGCKNTENVMVTVNSLPAVVATTTKTAVCSGESVTLTGTGASTYTWDNNVSNGVSFVPSATKTYIVTGTDANGCKNSANVLVIVNTSPTVIATATKTVVCSGESVTLTGTGASTYVWDNNVINGVSFVPSATKTYTVTGTDANGCFKAASISVAINNIPTVQIVSSNPTNKACEDANLELTTDVVGSYLWSNGEKTKNIYPIKSGVYSLNFTDNNGCSNTSNSIKVTIFTLPTVSITLNGNSTYCSTNLTELVSTTAASYLWNSGETTKSIKPTQTGSYFVKITDINGCSQTSQPVDIIVNNCAGIENLDNLFIKTYPNPVTDYLMIEINETLVGKNYFVTDVAGKLLISGSFEKTINQIDFNQYASGSYMIHINEQTFKFIKE